MTTQKGDEISEEDLVELFYHSENAEINATVAVDPRTALPVPQTLRLGVEGLGVRYFAAHAAGTSRADSEFLISYIDDFWSAFVDCANAGMFAGQAFDPQAGRLTLLESRFDLSVPSQEWLFNSSALDIGAYRIPLNFFSVLGMDSVTLETVEPTRDVVRIEVDGHAYPSSQNVEFNIERDPDSEFGSDNRGIQIVFADELKTEAVDPIIKRIDYWSTLVMFGGYTPSGNRVQDSGAMPDGTYQMDSHTIEQSFSEVFLADEQAFNSLFNYLLSIHNAGLLIEKVLLY
jgi:hypothetical protein